MGLLGGVMELAAQGPKGFEMDVISVWYNNHNVFGGLKSA
jgi:hypothetical protein